MEPQYNKVWNHGLSTNVWEVFLVWVYSPRLRSISMTAQRDADNKVQEPHW